MYNEADEGIYRGNQKIATNVKTFNVSKKTITINNVDKNIAIMKGSSFPNVEKGNFILAAHSGPAWNSFFNDLYILSKGDVANVYYKNMKYSYKLIDTYKVLKNGKVAIKRNKNKTTLTLITCTNGVKDKQSVYVFELESKNSY